jgi:hypothetical protein
VLITSKRVVFHNKQQFSIANIDCAAIDVRKASEKTARNIQTVAVLFIFLSQLLLSLNRWLDHRVVSLSTMFWFIVIGIIILIISMLYKTTKSYGVRVVEPQQGTIPLISQNKSYEGRRL